MHFGKKFTNDDLSLITKIFSLFHTMLNTRVSKILWKMPYIQNFLALLCEYDIEFHDYSCN